VDDAEVETGWLFDILPNVFVESLSITYQCRRIFGFASCVCVRVCVCVYVCVHK